SGGGQGVLCRVRPERGRHRGRSRRAALVRRAAGLDREDARDPRLPQTRDRVGAVLLPRGRDRPHARLRPGRRRRRRVLRGPRRDKRDREHPRARRVPPDHPGTGAEGGDRMAGREVPRGWRMTSRWRLGPLLAPRSIAVVGASEASDSWAPEIERSLRHVGYTGALYPVNPKYDTVWGVPCVPSIVDLPRNLDLVVFVVPARVVVGMID